jgi:hypothetical protein
VLFLREEEGGVKWLASLNLCSLCSLLCCIQQYASQELSNGVINTSFLMLYKVRNSTQVLPCWTGCLVHAFVVWGSGGCGYTSWKWLALPH